MKHAILALALALGACADVPPTPVLVDAGGDRDALVITPAADVPTVTGSRIQVRRQTLRADDGTVVQIGEPQFWDAELDRECVWRRTSATAQHCLPARGLATGEWSEGVVRNEFWYSDAECTTQNMASSHWCESLPFRVRTAGGGGSCDSEPWFRVDRLTVHTGPVYEISGGDCVEVQWTVTQKPPLIYTVEGEEPLSSFVGADVTYE